MQLRIFPLNKTLMVTTNKRAHFQRQSTKKRNHSPRYTYFIKSKYYPDTFTDPLFSSRGNWIKLQEQDKGGASSQPNLDLDRYKSSGNKNKGTKPVIDFVWLDSKKFRQDPRYNQLPARLTNFVTPDRSEITRKDRLITNLARIPGARKYLIPQLNIVLGAEPEIAIRRHITKFCKPGQIYIVKPVGGWLGTGIKIFSEAGEIIKYLLDVAGPGQSSSSWVIQEYITQPLLLANPTDGKHYKFHIRHYYVYQPRPRPSYYLAKGAFAIAKKPYIQGDWLNTDIHDTHFSDGEIWPDDMNPELTPAQLSSVNKQLADMYSYLDSVIHAGCYGRHRACFAVFGVDIMITAKLEVKLLEVNPNPGLDYNLPRLEGPLLSGIMRHVVDAHFKPRNKPALLDDVNPIQLIKIKRRTQTNRLTGRKTKRLLSTRKK